MICWRPSILTLLLLKKIKQRKKNISLSESELFSMKILTFSKKKRKLILSLVSFQKQRKEERRNKIMQRMSQHFDVWVTCTGNILVMNHTISSMDAFPWGEGAIVSECRKGVQHKTTPMAASLIAHRTSDTEKNNNFKNCRKG